MWSLFRQRKQTDNTSHSYDITRRPYWATENRLLDTVFPIYSTFLPPFFAGGGWTNMCGISIRASKGTAFDSFRKYKEKYNISHRHNPAGAIVGSLSLRFGIICEKNKVTRTIFPLSIRGQRKEWRRVRRSIPSISNLLKFRHRSYFSWFLQKTCV